MPLLHNTAHCTLRGVNLLAGDIAFALGFYLSLRFGMAVGSCLGAASPLHTKTRSQQLSHAAFQIPRVRGLAEPKRPELGRAELDRASTAVLTTISHLNPQAAWLHRVGTTLLRATTLAQTPKPYYSATIDTAVAYQNACFSRHNWPLPPIPVPHPVNAGLYATFAAGLLDGTALPELSGVQHLLVVALDAFGTKEGRLHPKVANLVQVLETRGVATVAELARVWRREAWWLVPEILALVRKAGRKGVEARVQQAVHRVLKEY